jgi:hypothetical protein
MEPVRESVQLKELVFRTTGNPEASSQEVRARQFLLQSGLGIQIVKYVRLG